jgi:nicotinamidase-related amidase
LPDPVFAMPIIDYRTDFVPNSRAASSVLIASVLLALTACDRFDAASVIETCVVSAMKHGEPYGNPKERAESEAQFRHYCAKAAASKHM